MKKFFEWIKEALSEGGVASSKRLLGAFVLISIIVVWSKETICNGLGEHETTLAEVLVTTAGVLLGITSVSNIFKNKNDE